MPVSRKRSCVECRSARTRCSLEVPKCSRCKSRNYRCSYRTEPTVPEASSITSSLMDTTASNPGLSDSTHLPVQTEPSSEANTPQRMSTSFTDMVTQRMIENNDSLFASESSTLEHLDWNNGQRSSKLIRGHDENIGASTIEAINETPFAVDESENLFAWLQQSTEAPVIPLIRQGDIWCGTTPKLNPKLLRPKVGFNMGSSLVSNYLIHKITSWPDLLLEENSLPQFIHWHCSSADTQSYLPGVTAFQLPEPLAICSSMCSIVQPIR
jgi:hypothetical protein